MAFLDNSGDIILDAVLTDTGRYRLAQGNGSFKIAKFALGDDEIDYSIIRKFGRVIGKEKIEYISEEEFNVKKQNIEDRNYPWSFLFELNKRLVYGLFLVVSFLTSSFLFLRAFEIKKLNQEVENYAEKIQFPVPIEFMFPCELIAQAVEENILEFDDRIARSTDSELPAEINLTEIYVELN